jgi:hypothetical protein
MYRGLHVNTRYSCQTLMKLEFSRQIFEKSLNIKFHENPSSWEQSYFMWMDRREKSNSHFSQFWTAPNNALGLKCETNDVVLNTAMNLLAP